VSAAPSSVPEEETRVLGRRVAAFLVDLAIAVGTFLLVVTALGDKTTADAPLPSSGITLNLTINDTQWYATGGRAALIVGILAAFALAYYAALPGRTGYTLGKALTGIRVAGPDGVVPAGVWRNFVRAFLWIADGLPYLAPGALGFVVAASSSKRRRIGDMVADTYVVRARPGP
jgi:uncharacterized RDD family membrane protein YckC